MLQSLLIPIEVFFKHGNTNVLLKIDIIIGGCGNQVSQWKNFIINAVIIFLHSKAVFSVLFSDKHGGLSIIIYNICLEVLSFIKIMAKSWQVLSPLIIHFLPPNIK
jgi:hypothetical protein